MTLPQAKNLEDKRYENQKVTQKKLTPLKGFYNPHLQQDSNFIPK